jgi:[acyl-carrier-protein] S-malonyltransferase
MNFAIIFSGQGLQSLAHVQELLTMADELHVSDILKQRRDYFVPI